MGAPLSDAAEVFLAGLAARLEQGAIEYGNQSFVRPVAALVDEIRQELLDEVGWIYVLWAVAARKAWGPTPEAQLRERFLADMRHRIARNDRSAPSVIPGLGAQTCLIDLQILALDMFEHAQAVERRLAPLARAIEVAQAIDPYRGRRGSSRDPRSSD